MDLEFSKGGGGGGVFLLLWLAGYTRPHFLLFSWPKVFFFENNRRTPPRSASGTCTQGTAPFSDRDTESAQTWS